jgi:hypothetical protein
MAKPRFARLISPLSILIYSHPEKDRKVMKSESSPNKKVLTFLFLGGC